jgi:hypothetical protein
VGKHTNNKEKCRSFKRKNTSFAAAYQVIQIAISRKPSHQEFERSCEVLMSSGVSEKNDRDNELHEIV